MSAPTFRGVATCACGDHGFIGLNRGLVALISPERVEAVSCHNWHAQVRKQRGSYVCRSRKPGMTGSALLHRVILDPPPSLPVDHASGDTLDNRDENLRVCTHGQNKANSRPYVRDDNTLPKGVVRRGKKFIARITSNYRMFYLGIFPTVEEAAAAYDKAAAELYGDFARGNEAIASAPLSLRRKQHERKPRSASQLKAWSETAEKYKQMAESGMYAAEAARALGVTREAVRQIAARYGIKFAPGRPGRPPHNFTPHQETAA